MHKSVLLQEVIEGLSLPEDAIVMDGTFGGGGHSAEICKRVKNVKIIALDQDAGALEEGKKKFESLGCEISFHNINFRDLGKVLQGEEASGVILDLGLSSDQLQSSGRGFSFMHDEPLLMTMKADPSPEDLTADDVVNNWQENSLADIIYGYGEERYARRIARGIVEARKNQKIKTTFDLVKIIESSVPNVYRRGHRQGGASKIHFATKTFQAIRIAVNDELNALKEGLEKGFSILNKGGRLAVISFHSLEDRIVKNFYREKVKAGQAKLQNKKPITASREEIKENPRSRSAKLRIIIKT